MTKLKDDLLTGAEEIAEFMFGDGKKNQRRVYHLAASNHLPIFRMGNTLCSRRSTLLAHVEGQEKASRPTAA